MSSSRIKPFSRGYVSTVQRDATSTTPAKKSYDASVDYKQAVKLGRAAEQRGEERFLNPFMFNKARAWCWAWERSHGQCAGCTQCGPGVPIVAEESFKHWLQRYEKRNKGYQDSRRQVLGGRTADEED